MFSSCEQLLHNSIVRCFLRDNNIRLHFNQKCIRTSLNNQHKNKIKLSFSIGNDLKITDVTMGWVFSLCLATTKPSRRLYRTREGPMENRVAPELIWQFAVQPVRWNLSQRPIWRRTSKDSFWCSLPPRGLGLISLKEAVIAAQEHTACTVQSMVQYGLVT